MQRLDSASEIFSTNVHKRQFEIENFIKCFRDLDYIAENYLYSYLIVYELDNQTNIILPDNLNVLPSYLLIAGHHDL